MFRWNPLCFSLCQLPPILAVDTTEKNLAPTSLCLVCRCVYLYINKVALEPFKPLTLISRKEKQDWAILCVQCWCSWSAAEGNTISVVDFMNSNFSVWCACGCMHLWSTGSALFPAQHARRSSRAGIAAAPMGQRDFQIHTLHTGFANHKAKILILKFTTAHDLLNIFIFTTSELHLLV